jgi:hypothetical protein
MRPSAVKRQQVHARGKTAANDLTVAVSGYSGNQRVSFVSRLELESAATFLIDALAALAGMDRPDEVPNGYATAFVSKPSPALVREHTATKRDGCVASL